MVWHNSNSKRSLTEDELRRQSDEIVDEMNKGRACRSARAAKTWSKENVSRKRKSPTGDTHVYDEQEGRRRCPQVLQNRTASNFRHPLGHPAAHLEKRQTGETGESLQDEDERGRMIVGQQGMSLTSAGTRKGE